ncbi:Zinc finger MYND domain-containing protein 15 [Schistosoma japonicum]|nr:Zinc finger MYND domain-containing protein 15 [Schistosoma japonicum]
MLCCVLRLWEENLGISSIILVRLLKLPSTSISPQCKALFYCSDKCRADDWISSSNPDHRHQQWCSRMKVFMDFEPVLQNLPFTFAPITTAPDFSWIKLDQILSYFGVNRQGLWKYEFPPTSYSRSCQISPGADLPLFSDLWTTTTMDSEKHALSPSCESPAPDLQEPTLMNINLRDWLDYYKWRGLCSADEESISNPLALILHWPLTLYHIAAHKLPQIRPCCIPKILKIRKLVIHVVGVEKELSLLPVFKELDHLFKPELRICIYFIGRHFDSAADKVVYHLSPRLSISVWSGLYHEFLHTQKLKSELPDLIIGFNAGLAAYLTWPVTLSSIGETGVPVFFTDSCLYSSLWGFQVTSSLGLGPSSLDSILYDCCHQSSTETQSCLVLNPFRSPIRIKAPGVRWGWFSNAFIFSPFYTEDYLQQHSDLPQRMASMSV